MRTSSYLLLFLALLLPANGIVIYKAWHRFSPASTPQPWETRRYRTLADEYIVLNKLHGESVPVLLVGDSNAEYFRVREYLGPWVINRGIGQDTSAGLLRRWDDTVAPLSASDVFVLIGTNDVLRAQEETTAANLRDILAKSGTSRIHVLSVLPTRHDGDVNDRIRLLNRRLAETVRAAEAEWIDLTSYFADDEGKLRRELTYDGLHLAGEGYAVLAQIIRRHLPERPR
jgi:lysophospholipase L1-like esterase